MTYYTQVLALGAMNALLALAAYLPLASGVMVVCLGAAMSIGAIAAGTMTASDGGVLSTVAALAVGSASGGLFMASSALVVRRMSGFMLAVTTLAIAELLRVVAQNEPMLGGALGFRSELVHPSLAWPVGTLVAAIALISFFERSHARHLVGLCKTNPLVAVAIGIDPSIVRSLSMTAGGMLAGASGALFIANVGILDPRSFGFEAGIQIAMFAIVGGTRSWVGPVLAGLGLTILPELLRFSTNYRMLLYGMVLVTVVILRPDGLWPLSTKKRLAVTTQGPA